MNDQLTGATNQLALFGKTFSQMRMDWDKGFRLSAFTKILPKVEVTTLKNLSIALKDNTVTAEQFNDVLSHTSTQAQIMGSHIIKLKAQLDAGKITTEEYDVAVQKMISSQSSASITSQLLSAAMRTIVNVGVGIAISGLITLFQKLVNAEKESIQATQDAAKESNSYIKSLDDLKSEYNDIINSTKTASEKTQDLKKWKSELIQLYKDEKEAIEDVNLNRETGIALLETEIRRTRDLWLGENQGNIEKAVRAIENSQYSDLHFIIDNDEIFSDGIRKEILELFDSYNQDTDEFKDFLTGLFNGYSEQTAEFKFDTDNIYDTKKRLEDVIALFGSFTDELSPNERELLAQLNNYKDKIDEVIQTHGTTYQTYKEYLAQNSADDLFDDYIKQQGKNIASVTEETFNSWKEGLIALAGESEPIRKALQEIIDNTFPQYAEKEEETTNKSNGLGDAVTSLSERITELDKSLDGIYESFDTAFSNQSTIQSAFDKIQSGTDLTTSEMKSLIKLCKNDFPEIGTLFTKTAKGWAISSDDLIKANNALMKSTKETVQQQIDGYNEVIRAYENRFVTIPKGGQTIQVETNVGISEEEYKNATEQVENLKKVLETLGLVLDNDTDKSEQFTKTLKTLSTNISAGVSAQKEMNESGKISASTLESLLSLGEDYIKCITIENGIIKFNAEEYKKLEKAKIDDKIATIELTEAEIIYNRNQAAMYGNSSRVDELNALLADEQAKRKLLESLRDNYDTDWTTALTDKTFKNDDPIKDAFQKRQKELEHLLNMEQITEAEYYKQLFDSKEYKALLADRTKYADELNSIDEKFYKFQQDKYKEDADKQFDDLEDQRKRGIITAEQYAQGLHDLGQELYGEGSIYGGTEFAIKALEELDKKVKETSEDIYDEFKEGLSADGDRLLDDVLADADKLSEKNIKLFSDDPKTFKKNAEDIFETVFKSAQDALGRELITPERYKEIIDKYSKGLNTGIIQNAYDDAFDAIADKGKDKLDKMLITPDEYFKLLDEWGKKLNVSKDVIDKLKEAVSESDYLERWDLDNGYDENKSKDDYDLRAKRIEYIYELAEQLYGKNGQKNLKAYNALINQGLEDVESLVEDYYDAEIKKLEKINDEEEKRQKALELQLNLIKARQKLEEAKSQKNQLVFHNGTFEYMADQEAVMSAEEDLAEAQKAILEQEREDQIKALEDQKAETLKFFNSVGGKLDDFINRVKRFLSGDKDAFKVDESKVEIGSGTKSDNESNANSVTTTTGSKDKTITSATDKTEINADNVEVKTDTGTSAVADTTDTATTEEPVVSINDLVSNIDANVTGISETATAISDATKGIFDTAKAFANGFNFENLVRALGGNPTAEAVKNFQDSYNATLVGKQITPSTLPSNITNNSSTTNNNAKTIINIEKIFENLYMPEGTTKEQVEAFFKHLNSAILQRIPQALIEVSK